MVAQCRFRDVTNEIADVQCRVPPTEQIEIEQTTAVAIDQELAGIKITVNTCELRTSHPLRQFPTSTQHSRDASCPGRMNVRGLSKAFFQNSQLIIKIVRPGGSDSTPVQFVSYVSHAAGDRVSMSVRQQLVRWHAGLFAQKNHPQLRNYRHRPWNVNSV